MQNSTQRENKGVARMTQEESYDRYIDGLNPNRVPPPNIAKYLPKVLYSGQFGIYLDLPCGKRQMSFPTMDEQER